MSLRKSIVNISEYSEYLDRYKVLNNNTNSTRDTSINEIQGMGQNQSSIESSDGSVVTKMQRKKNTELTFRYIPSGALYTAEQEAEFAKNEMALIDYVIENLLPEKVPQK